MASSSYTSAKWRSEVSDAKSSPASKKLEDELSRSYLKREDTHSLGNSQRLSLSGSARPKSRGSVIFEDDASSLALSSHDRLSRGSSDFSSNINSQRPKFLKSSLGSRRFGLLESDQLHSFREGEDDLRLKLQLNTGTNYSSPRDGRSLQHLNTGDSTPLDPFSLRKSQAEYESDLLSLQSSVTPRGELGHTTKKSLRLPSGLEKDRGAESFKDTTSLRSSVRFSDEIDSRTRLTGLDGDRKYLSDLRDGLSSSSPRVRSRELDHLGNEVKLRNTSDYDEKDQSVPKLLIKLRDKDHFDMDDVDKKSVSSRSSLTIREDPFIQSRKDGPRSYSFKSRMTEDLDKFPDSRYSGLSSEMDSTKYRTSFDRQLDGKNHTLGDVGPERPDSSLSRLLTLSSRSTDLERDRTSKLKLNKNEELYSEQKRYSSPRVSDTGSLRSRTEELYDGQKNYSSPRVSDTGSLRSRTEELYDGQKSYSSPRVSDTGVLRSRTEELYDGQKRYSSPRVSDTGALRSRDVSDLRSELQISSRSPLGQRPSDIDRKKLITEKDFDHRDRKSQLLTGAERKSILNQDHRSSLLDSRSVDPYENLGTGGHSYRKLNDVELGGLHRSSLLDDSMESRKKSVLLGKDNQIGNENRTAYESLGRNSEFEIKAMRDIYGSKGKELTQDFLSTKRSVSNHSHRLMADVTGTRYKIVERTIQMAGFAVSTSKDADVSLIWNDSFVSLEKISALGNHQRINHFVGMGEICHRSSLVKNVARLKSRFPSDYGFFPRSWVCPEDTEHFQAYYKDLKKKGKKKIYITKPIIQSKETGVRLFSDAEKIPVSDEIVIQEFLTQLLLINGRKFHVRCFVLVTSCDPLHIYLYSNGVAFLASESYVDANETNLNKTSIHITNDVSERCSLRQLLEKLHQSGVDTAELWKAMTDIIVKTLLLAHPHLYQNYKLCRFTKPREEESVCFEILGFDFLIDKDFNPWLLKVNQSPSFSIADDLDQEIKSGILDDALQLICLGLKHSRPKVMTAELATKALAALYTNAKDGTGHKKEEKEEEMKKQEVVDILERIKMAAKSHRFGNNCGGYKQIFPPPEKSSLEKYLKLMESAHVFIPGPDEKRRQEVKQFLIQREKDRLQAVIRCGTTHEGSHASRPVKIDIGEDLTSRTLKALNEMQITIPGKTEKAAASLIAKVHENWKLHKPKMAEFWFVHLDLNKREKVVNIVKNKVCSIAQSTWCTADVENVGLYRIFLRLFNRLLGCHGRGLWDCFHSKRNSWEMIFTKATDNITSTEMSCCRRIVQLCCDCLCIVYICTPQQS